MDQDGQRDLYERLTARIAVWSVAHPALVARWRLVWCVASWAALVVGVTALVLVPSTRRGLVVVVTVQWVLVQLWLLSRTKTVRWVSVARALTVGTLFAPVIGLADVAVMRVFGWTATDDAALVWVAGPVEEALKVAPLLVVLRVASQRARRLALVDYALLGMALGGGFQLVEDWVRRVAGGPPGLLAALLGDGSTQLRVLALFPGWQETPSGEAFFAGHFLLTALVALGVGWARRLKPRFGVRAAALPVALFVLVVLDHSLYNFHATLGTGPVPVWLQTAHRWWGAGREVRWLFVLLLLAAVVSDHQVLEGVRARLPALPGRAPLIGLVAAAERAGDRLRARTAPTAMVAPSDPAPARRLGASPVIGRVVDAVAAALPGCARAVSASLHELVVTLAAARAGPAVWFTALGVLRERRKLGFALAVDPTDAVRVEPVAPVVRDETERLTRLLLVSTACLVALLALAVVVGVADDLVGPAFLANLFDDLGAWWNGLALWQQFLVMGLGVGLLMLGGAGWAFALGAVGVAADVAARGQGIATFLRNPREATADFFRTLTPADVVSYTAGIIVARLLGPLSNRTVRRWLGEPLEDAAGEAAETAAERARRQATEAGIPRGFIGAEDFLQFGRRAQAGFAEAGYDDVTLAIRGSAVTGVGHGSGLPFDEGRVSDFDLAVVSPQMWEQAQGMGIRLRTGGTRTPVLTPDVLRQLGLRDVVDDLNAAAGRPVSLMLYRTAQDIAARGPSITWPRT